MVKLSLEQRKIIAEILGNIAVGWFVAGVISPIFLGSDNFIKTAALIVPGIFMTIFFSIIALLPVRKVKS